MRQWVEGVKKKKVQISTNEKRRPFSASANRSKIELASKKNQDFKDMCTD